MKGRKRNRLRGEENGGIRKKKEIIRTREEERRGSGV